MDQIVDFEAVIRLASEGDIAAIELLWIRHQPALLGWLTALAPRLGEDVASETWIDVMEGLAKFTGGEPRFRSWLFTIGRRRLIDRQRRSIRRPDRFAASNAEMVQDDDASRHALRTVESEQAVAQIVAILPKDQAEVVLLRVLGGLGVVQVADVLGKSPGAVRVLQHRGLRKLSVALSFDFQETSTKKCSEEV